MKLPKLLAGPIVRRVEQSQAYIWLAMSKPYHIDAELFTVTLTSKKDTFDYRSVSIETKCKVIELGKNLYTYLIKITPSKGTFPEDVLLGYNLHFSSKSEKLDLGSFDLLSKENPNSLVYENMKYPTFFISKSTDKLLFGSCRKLHGKGEDSLASGDIKLKETYFDLKERPSGLFLVGDQIYADDVADPIFPFIYHLGIELTGTNEGVSKIDNRLSNNNFLKSLRQVRGRQYIMEKFCKFTSNKAHNHLISFGEFAAMYLLSYSPDIWDITFEENHLQPFEQLTKEEQVYFIFPNAIGYEDEYATEFMENKRRYEEKLEELQLFRQTLPQIRRLLANIPTYMMFDDHDITDDFNISLEWKEDVENSALGKHVIANGLTSYWLFQGWGNAPEKYTPSFYQNMQNYLQTYDVNSDSYQIWQDTILKFNNWAFVAPTYPKALFLDTRTKRSFANKPIPTQVGKIIKEISSGPQLISESEWKMLTSQLKESGWQSGMPLVLVSPAPFYGIRLIESFLYQYVLPFKLLRLPVQTKFDLEAWRFNGKGYHLFHQWISKWNPSSCTILSGDAHMASSVETVVTFKDSKKRKLHQFTCSPMKNDSFSTLTELVLKTVLLLHSVTTGKNEIQRVCDLDFKLSFDKSLDSKKHTLWKEVIQYQSLPSGSIVETNNNLGLLSLEGPDPKIELLQYKDGQLEDRAFR